MVMYVKDGRALCLAGVGKVDSALRTTAILSDERFDFSDAYIISVGCAGSARGYSVMGDVVVITGISDYDLGHHVDPRDLKDPDGPTWFYDDSLDNCASVVLNRDLTDRVYDLTKDMKLESTDRTRKAMTETFAGEEWAARGPEVIKGADVTGDDFWKGEQGDSNAKLITETYGMPDPFALTDMEEIAKANAAKRLGMGDRYIAVRVSVNMDVFMKGESPESLWNTGESVIENNLVVNTLAIIFISDSLGFRYLEFIDRTAVILESTFGIDAGKMACTFRRFGEKCLCIFIGVVVGMLCCVCTVCHTVFSCNRCNARPY